MEKLMEITGSPVNQWFNLLEESGYRLTRPRRAIIKIIANADRLLDPSELFILARKDYPNIGLVTVYRTLEKLEELGLVQRVHEINGCHTYIAAPQGHQHVLVCSTCYRAEYFEGDDIKPLISRLGSERGYQIRDHWLQLSGTCPRCLADAESQKNQQRMKPA